MASTVAKTSKSPWASSRDRAAEREEKREAVLHAAAQAFSDNGFYKTSLDDIAERLGVTKPTLYYYAKNKEDLVVAVAARALEQILIDLPGDPRASGYAQLRRFVTNFAHVILTDFGRCLIQLRDSDLGQEAGGRLREGKGSIDKRMRGLIQTGIADGSIAECDPKLTAFLIAGTINGIVYWHREGVGLDASAIIEIYINQLSTGLLPR